MTIGNKSSTGAPPSASDIHHKRSLLRKVQVNPTYATSQLLVYWDPTDLGPFLGFNVYRTQSPVTYEGVSPLNGSPLKVLYFLDKQVPVTAAHFYYTVTGIHMDGTEIQLDEPVTLLDGSSSGRRITTISPYRIFREFVRRKSLIQQNTGDSVLLLVRLQAGQRCPSCFNGEYEQSSRKDCIDCYGTSWKGGYELVSDVSVSFRSNQETLRLLAQGLTLDAMPDFWLPPYPLIRNGDVLVKKSGLRYQIDNVDYNYCQGVLTEMSGKYIQLPLTDPVYGFDLVADFS